MSDTFKLRDLYRSLNEDSWRLENQFSPDIEIAHKVLLSPFASYSERKEMISNWLQRPSRGEEAGNQPCLFGRIAAHHAMEYCVLTENDIVDSDSTIKAQVDEALLAWKRRSADPKLFDKPAHGFMVLLVGRRIAYAAPDDHLLQFALAFQELWGCTVEKDARGNSVAVETLYLRNPLDSTYVRFTFSIDYFGSQGDQRWWHDHRVPGGIAFTANSAGHMKRYYEWYRNKPHQAEWLLQTAMRTIDEAAHTKYGRATWLRDLSAAALPFVEDVACPVAKDRMQAKLLGKDWTTYEGYLYSDHSVRREFFRIDPEPPKQLVERPWAENFTYLYDPQTKDHARFIAGEVVSAQEIRDVLGDRREWQILPSKQQRGLVRHGGTVVPDDEAAAIAKALETSAQWRLTDSEVGEITN